MFKNLNDLIMPAEQKKSSTNDGHLKKSNKGSEDSVSEQNQNSAEVALLLQAVPRLKDVFVIKKKIGEGTFSRVFLAKFKDSFGINSTLGKYVALKHIVPTSHPSRILVELECMQKYGNRANVMGILSCVREGSNIVMVMPYFPHDRFTEYVGRLDLAEIRDYMRKLLEALSMVHGGGVIHRDVKPSNFLYNRKLRRYALVDFGLSQKAPKSPASNSASSITHRQQPMSRTGREESKPTWRLPSSKAFVKLLPPPLSSSSSHHQLTIRVGDAIRCKRDNGVPSTCDCHGLPQLCRSCLAKPIQVASRAGTPGFRPPEVLLKHPYQTTAVDVWAAGVIFLCLLSGRYPFFHGLDDMTALTEITTLVGSVAIKRVAAKLGKVVVGNPEKPALALDTVCEQLRPELKEMKLNDGKQLSDAFDLLKKMLDINFESRILASDALAHPFFV